MRIAYYVSIDILYVWQMARTHLLQIVHSAVIHAGSVNEVRIKLVDFKILVPAPLSFIQKLFVGSSYKLGVIITIQC